jgi:tetratricopeptide (TPR) repeat protein
MDLAINFVSFQQVLLYIILDFLKRNNRMKHVLVLAGLLLMFGCGSKKADPAQLAKGNDLVTAGKYEEGAAVLDEMAKQSSDDPALKQARINAHLKFANYYMYNDSLSPKVKYPSALRQYRAVLALDASNAEAKQGADLIIGIYNQMGRPIPAQ